MLALSSIHSAQAHENPRIARGLAHNKKKRSATMANVAFIELDVWTDVA